MHEYTYILSVHQILLSLDFCLSSSKENVMKQHNKCKQNDELVLILNLNSSKNILDTHIPYMLGP